MSPRQKGDGRVVKAFGHIDMREVRGLGKKDEFRTDNFCVQPWPKARLAQGVFGARDDEGRTLDIAVIDFFLLGRLHPGSSKARRRRAFPSAGNERETMALVEI